MALSDNPLSLIYSVTDINSYVKNLLKSDENLHYVLVRGEISNLKVQAGVGHHYFSLKDEESMVNVTLFNSYASKLDFALENGMEVIILASVDLYVSRGSYQLNAYQVEQVGEGKALVELEKLKQKLNAEGLFDPARKRKINIFPNRIGVISGKGSAAIKDITYNVFRRYPCVEIYFFPSQVQGDGAAKDIIRAFDLAQKCDLDTLIISRGGGASEDLAAFNDEALVRRVAASKMPVISAVGHEIDTTLVELASDLRVSTPTGAAEAATIDKREIEQSLFGYEEEMNEIISSKVKEIRDSINSYKKDINNILIHKLDLIKSDLNSKKSLLDSLNPYSVLSRGYSLTYNEKGKVVTSIGDVNEGENIRTLVSDGEIHSKVSKKEKK
ncbi:MAG: exodeoxyribonuclease VII large subunit [Coprobacillus sp.]|nr:exodeoxyribonuclease VII large subunit [Coprobacillus sp.]